MRKGTTPGISHPLDRVPLAAHATPPPPQTCLLRSRSSAPSSSSSRPATDTLQPTSQPSSSGQRFSTTNRSKSTSRTRPSRTDRQNDESNGNGNANSSHGVSVTRKSRSAPPSPSAWALSSGRASSTEVPNFNLPPPAVKSEDQRTRGKNHAVSKVLKYFKQKKVSPSAEEEFHKLRILHNRLVQWRFVNARARASIDSIQRKAQERLLAVWLNIAIVRNSVTEKRIEANRLGHKIKVGTVAVSQMGMLDEWAVLEKKLGEGVARLSRKLQGLSLLLPLEDAKGEMGFFLEAMRIAVDVMDTVSLTTRIAFPEIQAKELIDMITELLHTLELQNKCLEELEDMVSFTFTLQAREESLRAHAIQALKEQSRRVWGEESRLKLDQSLAELMQKKAKAN